MTDILTFSEALERSAEIDDRRHLLFGNGFSITRRLKCFTYSRLLDDADLRALTIDGTALSKDARLEPRFCGYFTAGRSTPPTGRHIIQVKPLTRPGIWSRGATARRRGDWQVTLAPGRSQAAVATASTTRRSSPP